MPSSPKIPKELILKTALELLIHDGYEALNIKALAGRLGSSTQPISWHFGNMEGLRRELAVYALAYANERMRPVAENSFEAFTEIGAAYIDMAFDEPKLFRYLYMDGTAQTLGSLDALMAAADNCKLEERIAEELQIGPEAAAAYIGNCMIYTHGLLTLVVSGVMKGGRTQVREMVDRAGYAFLAQAGADDDAVKALRSRLAYAASPEDRK